MIKILYVVTTLGRGGVQEHICQLINQLDPDQYNVWVAYGNPADHAGILEKAGATLVNISLVKSLSIYNDSVSLLKLWRLMKKNNFDIVHTHMTKASILGRLAARLAGAKVVIMTGHGLTGILENTISNKFAQKAFVLVEWLWARLFTDIVILVNESDKKSIVFQGIIPKKKIKVVLNGINLTRLTPIKTPIEKRKELNISEDVYVIIMVGRLCNQKAPEIFIRAAEKIQTQRNDICFLLVGDGPKLKIIREMITDFPFPSQIKVLGNRYDIVDLLSVSDLFVLPSIYEGMPISILEAMALDLPVIASDVPGNRSLVKHNQTGMLVPVNNTNELANMMIRVLQDEYLKKRLTTTAKQMVKKDYTAAIMTTKTTDIYINQLTVNR